MSIGTDENLTPIVHVTSFTVDPGEVAGYDVVILVLEASDGEEKVVLPVALPSEDAVTIGRRLVHVGSGVRPFHVQQRNIDGLLRGQKELSE